MRKAQIAALTVATLAVASAYYGLADSLDLVPGPLSAASSSYRPQPYPTPSPPAEESGTPSGLDADAPAPTAAALNSMASTLASDPMVGKGTTATTVIDVATGETLLDVNGGSALTPASSNKVLTAWAALSVLGPDHTLTTKAVVSGGTVTLVGGGDVLLAADAGDPSATVGHAGLGDLARSTAEALKDKGVTSVSVALDDTLFTGPSWNSSWEDGNQAWVAPIQPIMLDVTAHSHSGAYPSDPAMEAAKAFSDQLTAAGVAVTGDVTRGAASSDASELASVESAPLADVLSVSLKTSDNTMTEVEGRLVAIDAHREATFEGATGAVLAQLGTDGFDTTGVTMLDCSGLALGDKVSSRLLAQIIARSAGGGVRPGKGVRVRAVGVRSACEPVGAGPVGIGGGFGVGSVHQGLGPLRAGRGLPRPGSGPVRSRLRPVGAGRRLRTGDADGDEPCEQFSADGFRLGGVHKLRGAEAERPAVGQEDVQPFAVSVDESALEFGVRRCDLDRPVHESHVFIVSRKACVPDVRSSTA